MADKLAVKYDSIAEAMADGMVNKPHAKSLTYAKLIAVAPPVCFYCGRQRDSSEFCKGCGASVALR